MFPYSILVEPACGPVEEGQPLSLTCDVSRDECAGWAVTWQAQAAGHVDVVSCISNTCAGGVYSSSFPTTINSTTSILNIPSVSRTDPFNMQTKWKCDPCNKGFITVCDTLELYSDTLKFYIKPTSPACRVTENTTSGDITSITITCSVSKVYPQAKCTFYRRSQGGNTVRINTDPAYSHTEIGTTPVYYWSTCSVSVSVEELGEGTHSFEGFIYPDVTGGENLVPGTGPHKNVYLSFPQVSHSCLTETVQGYFLGTSARCTCNVTSDGYPRGSAQWYKGDVPQPVGDDGALVVTFDKNNPQQVFTCEATSALGRKVGSTLTVTFTRFPQVSHSCLTETVQGYFLGTSARCTCNVTSDGFPRGSAQWYKGGVLQPVGDDGALLVTFDKNYSEQVYTCEAQSALGRKVGSKLTAKFAFMDSDWVECDIFSDEVTICDNNSSSSTQAMVSCLVSKEHVSPAPTFSFSLDGRTFEDEQLGIETGIYYLRHFTLSPDIGEEFQIVYRVSNTVTNSYKNYSTQVIGRTPPHVTVDGQTYQGIKPSNIVTLPEGDTGDVTCRVDGGYPDAHTTQLKCGQLNTTGDGNTATLRFAANHLTRKMEGTVCTCTSQHASGCYDDNETGFIISVTYGPEITFIHSPIQTTFNKSDTVRFNCSVEANPDPTSVTITRARTNEILGNVQTAKLTYTLDSLDCLDTGVYVCSGQNTQKITSREISVFVNCPQQLNQSFEQLSYFDAVIGQNAKIRIDVYGFPEPKELTLRKMGDDIDLASSPRHKLEYTADVAPFGFVSVIIFDVAETDFTTFTLTIDNDVGDPLSHSFSLNQIQAQPGQKEEENEDTGPSVNIAAVIIGVVAAVLVAAAFVVIVYLVRKNHLLRQHPATAGNQDDINLTPNPAKTPDIVKTPLDATGDKRVRRKGNKYTNDLPRSVDKAPLSTSKARRQSIYENMDLKPGTTSASSASLPPGTARCEGNPDTAPASGLYHSTSREDMEPPDIYRRFNLGAPSKREAETSGVYGNMAYQHTESDLRSPQKETTETKQPDSYYLQLEESIYANSIG
ncbi:hemicentin-2 [Elysia marginata]|uniref:Hemicentin-2 n=1 Tax=Elysia marginata TaxID=1093978 RepID=A0AAV4EGW9_9GAST|nr:hemicentin-2 [Elysia marginata]